MPKNEGRPGLLRPAACAGLLCVTAQVVLSAAQAIQVTPVVRDGRVLVSFKLSDAFNNEEIRAAIHSGLTITFVYDVDLRRSAAAWVDRTIDAATVSAGVQYDNLARRYHVTLRAEMVEEIASWQICQPLSAAEDDRDQRDHPVIRAEELLQVERERRAQDALPEIKEEGGGEHAAWRPAWWRWWAWASA